MYEIIFSDRSKRELEKLDRTIQERIIKSLERIRIRPESYVTKLVGDIGYKFRVGDYQVLLDIDKGRLEILIIKVGHRRNIYDRVAH